MTFQSVVQFFLSNIHLLIVLLLVSITLLGLLFRFILLPIGALYRVWWGLRRIELGYRAGVEDDAWLYAPGVLIPHCAVVSIGKRTYTIAIPHPHRRMMVRLFDKPSRTIVELKRMGAECVVVCRTSMSQSEMGMQAEIFEITPNGIRPVGLFAATMVPINQPDEETGDAQTAS